MMVPTHTRVKSTSIVIQPENSHRKTMQLQRNRLKLLCYFSNRKSLCLGNKLFCEVEEECSCPDKYKECVWLCCLQQIRESESYKPVGCPVDKYSSE